MVIGYDFKSIILLMNIISDMIKLDIDFQHTLKDTNTIESNSNHSSIGIITHI